MNDVSQKTKQQKHKRKKLPLFVVLLLAGTGFFLARGVAAGPQNSILLNGANKMMGGEDVAVTACDSNMTITRTPTLYSGSATSNQYRYMIQRVTISGVNQYAPAIATSSIGVEGCGNQVLNMAIFNGSGTLQQASWTIPSAAISNGSFYFDWEMNRSSNGAYYADVTLNQFESLQDVNTKYAVRTYRTPY